ncbi:sialate:O-sulfotransferase 1-like [Daphnia carinata]|uniref:sialate:O-sulfotransferase 1-like n=1 Tax=Daphnia carinata TaxID=120202 RepID=UPI00257CBF4B|nr:sialate:O-sulfotransferase 1-like [Daphnia carinata]
MISVSLFGLGIYLAPIKPQYRLAPFQLSAKNATAFISNDEKQSIASIRTSLNPRITYPWKGDPSCQHITIQMAQRDSLPKWALTSFPGSGVTWLRQMIESLTGIYTGSVHKGDPLPFRDNNKNYMGITDNPFCGCTIIDKDHEATAGVYKRKYYLQLLQDYSNIINTTYNYRGILLLRNPMDVVFAHQNHLLVGKFDVAPVNAFRGPVWDELVDAVAFAWSDHAIRWIEQMKQGTAIFYEHFLGDNAQHELERLLDAMNYNPQLLDPERMRCLLAHRNQSEYKRSNKTRFVLEEHHRQMLLQSIHAVQRSLRQRKWPQLPVSLYDMHLPAEEKF